MVEITRLEQRTIQVMDGNKGVVLYFDTVNEADRIHARLNIVNDPMAYAEKIRQQQQERYAAPIED